MNYKKLDRQFCRSKIEHITVNYANATVVTFNSVILIFLIAVLSDALMIIISPMFISVLTLLKYPLAVIVANVSSAQ